MRRWVDRLTVLGTAGAVVVSVAAAAADATWHMADVTEGMPRGEVASASGVPTERAPDLGPILALAPFGTVVEVPVPGREPEETSLKLVLHGVVVADPPDASIAYISSADRQIEAYGIDDPVADDAILKEVYRDRAVLSVGGQREILSFPETLQSASQRNAAAVRARMQAAAGTSALPAAGSSPDEVVEYWRRRVAANPKDVLDQLGLAATPDGYRIGEDLHPGVRRAGFRQGDLVARVNGKAVGDIEKDRTLYDEIAASGRARVELVRNGQTIVMSFPLR